MSRIRKVEPIFLPPCTDVEALRRESQRQLDLIAERVNRLELPTGTGTSTTIFRSARSSGSNIVIPSGGKWRLINSDSTQLSDDYIILVDTDAVSIVFQLLSFAVVKGKFLYVKKVSPNNNTITIRAAEGENIDGLAEIILSEPYACWIGGASGIS